MPYLNIIFIAFCALFILCLGSVVVFAPRNADNVGLFDVKTRKFETISSELLPQGGKKYEGAAAVGSVVVFTPRDADNVGLFDVKTRQFETIASGLLPQDGNKYQGAAAVGSVVVFAPRNADNVGVAEFENAC